MKVEKKVGLAEMKGYFTTYLGKIFFVVFG